MIEEALIQLSLKTKVNNDNFFIMSNVINISFATLTIIGALPVSVGHFSGILQ